MQHYRIIVKDICANETEDIIDGNVGTKCEWLQGSDDTGNIYVVRAVDEECYISALTSLEDAGADIEEL